MYKTIATAVIASVLSTAAFAQTGSPRVDPFDSNRSAQNSALTIETLTLAHCDRGYEKDMKFSQQEFDARCTALRAAK